MAAQPESRSRPFTVAEAGQSPGAAGARWPAFALGTIALASLGTGAVHAATLKTDGSVSPLYFAFFLGVAVAQIGWAAVVVARPARLVLLAGAAGNAAVLVTWIVSRTAGPPVGPAAGIPLPVAFPDALTVALESLVILGAIALAVVGNRDRSRPPLVPTVTSAVVILGWSVLAILVQLALVTIGSLPPST